MSAGQDDLRVSESKHSRKTRHADSEGGQDFCQIYFFSCVTRSATRTGCVRIGVDDNNILVASTDALRLLFVFRCIPAIAMGVEYPV